MGRQRSTYLNPAFEPSYALQPPPQPQTKPAHRRRKPPNPWVIPWILQEQEKGFYSNLLANLIHTDTQGTKILVGCHLPFLPHRGMHTPLHQEISNQFQEAIRSWTETGNNPETPGHWRDLHIPTESLVGWPHHHLQIHPPSLPSHPC